MVQSSFHRAAAALALLLLHVPFALSLPGAPSNTALKTSSPPIKVIDADFADPSLLQVNGTWYSHATSGNGKVIQVATSTDFLTWKLEDIDAMPQRPAWASQAGIWAPDVIQRYDGKFVMYYAAQPQKNNRYCVGAAVADSPLGPFNATDSPLACPTKDGGAIDPAGYVDGDTYYVVYKVDGNSIGKATPLMLQKLKADAVTPFPKYRPRVLLQKDRSDGPLIEAPSIAKRGDLWYLFFSSNMFDSPNYDISYSASTKLEGPYTKTNVPFALTGDFPGLTAPGGASVSPDMEKMVHHAFRNGVDIKDGRAMFVVDLAPVGLSRCGH